MSWQLSQFAFLGEYLNEWINLRDKKLFTYLNTYTTQTGESPVKGQETHKEQPYKLKQKCLNVYLCWW